MKTQFLLQIKNNDVQTFCIDEPHGIDGESELIFLKDKDHKLPEIISAVNAFGFEGELKVIARGRNSQKHFVLDSTTAEVDSRETYFKARIARIYN